MSTTERTVRCGICGDPYKVYLYYAGDQSACPACVKKAEDKMRKDREADISKAVERLTKPRVTT